jgi:hypothetical protein
MNNLYKNLKLTPCSGVVFEEADGHSASQKVPRLLWKMELED